MKRYDTFEPIPSAGGKYEINESGTVRNAKTKRLLTPNSDGRISLRLDGKNHNICINTLLAQTHGIIRKWQRRAVILSKGNQRHFFETKSAAAKFLAPKVFRKIDYVQVLLSKKRKNIDGWRVNVL